MYPFNGDKCDIPAYVSGAGDCDLKIASHSASRLGRVVAAVSNANEHRLATRI